MAVKSRVKILYWNEPVLSLTTCNYVCDTVRLVRHQCEHTVLAAAGGACWKT